MKGFSKIASLIIILVILAGGYWFFENARVCGFAITAARNRFTDVCKEFPSTCLPLWYRDDVTCQKELGWKSPGDLISSEDTSTWKTYRNEKYGFEVRHPSEWDRQEWVGTKGDALIVLGEPPLRESIHRLVGSEVFALGGVEVRVEISDMQPSGEIPAAFQRYPVSYRVEKHFISIAGIKADYYRGFPARGQTYSYIYLPHGEKFLALSHLDSLDPKVLEEILSTFKFIQ